MTWTTFHPDDVRVVKWEGVVIAFSVWLERPSVRFCNEFIDSGGDGWGGTYCKLPAGHRGDHSAHYPSETIA